MPGTGPLSPPLVRETIEGSPATACKPPCDGPGSVRSPSRKGSACVRNEEMAALRLVPGHLGYGMGVFLLIELG